MFFLFFSRAGVKGNGGHRLAKLHGVGDAYRSVQGNEFQKMFKVGWKLFDTRRLCIVVKTRVAGRLSSLCVELCS